MTTNKTINVGQHFVSTVTAADGSVIPPGGVTVANSEPTKVSVLPNGDNTFTITGLAGGQTVITYMRPGFTNASELLTVVAAVPGTFIVTDGPVGP